MSGGGGPAGNLNRRPSRLVGGRTYSRPERVRSELQRAADAEALDVAADGAGRHGPLTVEVVELHLDVAAPVPVDADGVLAVGAALDGVGVQVDVGIAV